MQNALLFYVDDNQPEDFRCDVLPPSFFTLHKLGEVPL